MSDKELLIDFLMDVNRLNLDADPHLHYTLYFLKDEKFLIQQDIELRKGIPQWKQDEVYTYSHNYNFEDDKLTELYLSKMNITVIPDTISTFTNLKKIFFANNVINHLPDEMMELKKLTHLNLNNNMIKEIPESLENLERLENLQLANNQIREVPHNLVNLLNLKELNLANNEINNLSEGIEQLKNNGVTVILD